MIKKEYSPIIMENKKLFQGSVENNFKNKNKK